MVLEGEVIINGSESVREGQLAVLSQAGDAVHLEATAPAKVLLMAGEPLQEPIVAMARLSRITKRRSQKLYAILTAAALAKSN